MLLVPVSQKINWKHPPVITILMILINVSVFVVLQNDDTYHYRKAETYYVQSGLARIELDAFFTYLIENNQLKKKPVSPLPEKMFQGYLKRMRNNTHFQFDLNRDQIIRPPDPQFNAWKEKRNTYHTLLSRVVSYHYGFKPAKSEPWTLITSLFLHGGIGHLAGNMIFLWMVGCILEAGCGRFRYAAAYLVTGIISDLFFKLVYWYETGPLVGASGAISGLMGMLAVLYGRKVIKVFFSIGFFFNTFRMPAIVLLILWIGNEIIQWFWGQASNVAYAAHIGGLLSGAAIAVIFKRIPDAVDETVFEADKKDRVAEQIEQALEKKARLDLNGAQTILESVLKEDPENIKALTSLFDLYRHSPETSLFHKNAEQVLAALSSQYKLYGMAFTVYKEYITTAKIIRLSPQLLVRLVFVFCELGEPEPAYTILTALIKQKKDQSGLPAALLKLAFAFKKKGMERHHNNCTTHLLKRYPQSKEALSIVTPVY